MDRSGATSGEKIAELCPAAFRWKAAGTAISRSWTCWLD